MQRTIYKLRWAADDHFAMFHETPRSRSGDIIDNEPSPTEALLLRRDARPMGDCVAIMGGYLIMSERFKAVCPDSECVRWIPVRSDPLGLAFDSDYWMACPAMEFFALDERKSLFTYFPGTTVIGHISKWVMHGSRLPNCALFKANRKWFATHDVVVKANHAHLAGICFEPVDVS
jgi:hypothetical protein